MKIITYSASSLRSVTKICSEMRVNRLFARRLLSIAKDENVRWSEKKIRNYFAIERENGIESEFIGKGIDNN